MKFPVAGRYMPVMERASEMPAGLAFGRFQVLPRRRELLAYGQPIKLGGRAFDVLMALIDARGEIVGRRALMERVWPDRVIDENNLQSQIAALRAAFGTERDLIRTVSGRGYQFTGEVRVLSGSPDEPAAAGMVAQPPRALPRTNLPAPVSELIGRDAEVAEVVGLVGAHRLVSLTGAGGIGKTQLTLAAARRLLVHFADGVWLAELAPLSDPGLVPATVAAAVGLELGGGEVSPRRVAQALADRPLLLVLDNCEHVIAAAAEMVEALLHASPTAHVIATSREPLKAEGEWIYPVPPLAVPAAEDDDFWRCGAAWLFVLRSRASGAHISEDRHTATFIATICQRLDGIPLAIELAAARCGALGVEEVAARLDDRFRLLTGGHRTAMPRHQALRATLDWSYELLSEPERVMLRRIAVFAGAFRLDAAAAVVASPELPPSAVVEALANLTGKSLVVAEVDGRVLRYRLLDTTRAYALEKLGESGDADQAARRCAEFFLDLFVKAAPASSQESVTADLAQYAREIDNVRAAIDWCFSAGGDSGIGIALTAAYAPIWLHLSLAGELRDRAEHALGRADANLSARTRMELQIALGTCLTVTLGSIERTRSVLTAALETAVGLDDLDAQVRALWALWTLYFNTGEFNTAQSVAERFSLAASRTGDPGIVAVADRVMGYSLQYVGNHHAAHRCFERVLRTYVAPRHQRDKVWFLYDQRILTRAMLARSLWLQGFVDQARSVAQASVTEAETVNSKLTICFVLALAVFPIALNTGDLVAAEHALDRLIETATKQSFARYVMVGRRLEAALLIERREFEAGTALVANTLDAGTNSGWLGRFTEYLSTLAQGLAGVGEIGKALAMIDQALARADRGAEHWYDAELLRIKGELLLREATAQSVSAAEDCLFGAINVAQEQGALFWELRASTSLARLYHQQGRNQRVRDLLTPVYDRFTEGFDTADLQAAKALLDAL